MRKILLLLFSLAFFAACKSPQHYVKYDESSAYYLELQGKGYVMPLIGDISVTNQRITFEQVFTNNLKEEDVQSAITPAIVQYMKNYTLTQAAIANNADIIVSPLIDVKTSADYTTITVKLTGYPACYTNFRNATKEDFEILRLCEKTDAEKKLAEQGIIAPSFVIPTDFCDRECPSAHKKHSKGMPVTPADSK